MIHLTTTITGPYDDVLNCQPKAISPTLTVGPDPYPPDVLAACPMAREWGVRLVHKVEDSVAPWCWDSDCGHWWMQSGASWQKSVGRLGNYETRDRALRSPPTVPPPGFAPKAKAKSPTLLERCAEAAEKAWDKEDLATIWEDTALAAIETALAGEVTEEEYVEALRVYDASIGRYNAMSRALKHNRLAILKRLRKEATSKGGSDGK